MKNLAKLSTITNKLLNIVLKTNKKILVSSFIIGVIAVSSGSLMLASHATKKQVEGIAITPTAKPSPTATVTPTITPTPTVQTYEQNIQPQSTQTPLIDCVGIDGKHMQVTQAECNNFNKAWGNVPTPTPQPQTSGNVNTSSNSNTQSSTTNQTTNPVLVPVVANPTPAAKLDCSGVSGTIANIKNIYQPEIDSVTTTTNNSLGARGISSDSGYGQQQIQAALQPIYAQENAQIAQFCLNVTRTTTCSCP